MWRAGDGVGVRQNGRATGTLGSMVRRGFLMLVAGVPAVVAMAAEPSDVFGALASALAERDAASFAGQFEAGMPGLDRLRADVAALVEQADVISSIDFVSRRDEEGAAVLEVDWAMNLQSRNGAGGPTERRRRVLTARLKQSGKHWRIVSLEPLEFFRPPQF